MNHRALPLLVLLVVGCTPPASSTDASIDAGPSPTLDAGGPPPTLDCVGILGCVGACTNDPCVSACLDAGTPDARAQALALAACANANGCGNDEGCLASSCAPEIRACTGASVDAGSADADSGSVVVPPGDAAPDATADGFPRRIEGTTRDLALNLGVTNDSTGTAVFVRDDVTGDLLGFPNDDFVFYRLDSLTYRYVVSGSSAGCTFAADVTITPASLPPLENNLVISRRSASGGTWEYTVATAHTTDRTGSLVVTCPPPGGASTPIFHPDHYVSSGVEPHPRSDLRTFTGEFARGTRTSSWNLRTTE